MTEDPKELVAREVLNRLALESGEWGSISFTAGGWNPWPIAVAAMLEYARLTADRERSVGEDVVERKLHLEFRPDEKGRFDEILARFADGMVHAEMMTDKSCYVGFYWDDGRLCQWWISSDKKLRCHHEVSAGFPPRFSAHGVDRAAIAATPPQLPEGFVLVPKVLTEAMLQAAAETPGMKAASQGMEMHQVRGYGFAPGSFDAGSPLEQAWSAMIAAAAPAPALPETGVGNGSISTDEEGARA